MSIHSNNDAKRPGIYIHVPFCRRKCPYCDFYSITDTSGIKAWFDALIAEIRMAERFSEPADTVYIGGGTPSLLGGQQIGQLLEAVYAHFDMAPGAEITLEANPGTISSGQLSDYRAAGVNRLNLGVQSFNDGPLRFLGRIHSGREAARAIGRAQKAGYMNIGLDLIYGLPGQSEGHWQQELKEALTFSPAHLSCYLLTYAPGTPMAAALERRTFNPLPENTCREMFLLTHDYLVSKGYHHYEVSNFSANESFVSRHNRKYWENAPYAGLGPAAHSFSQGRRWWNVASVQDYISAIESRQSPAAGMERLSVEQEMIEAIYLGLRRAAGIAVAAFQARFGVDFKAQFSPVIDRFENEGYLTSSNSACALTRTGMLYADGIASAFVDRL